MKTLIYKIYDKITFNQNKYLKEFLKLDSLQGNELQKYQFQKIKKCSALHGISIESWDDFYSLPVTTKKDLPPKRYFTRLPSLTS